MVKTPPNSKSDQKTLNLYQQYLYFLQKPNFTPKNRGFTKKRTREKERILREVGKNSNECRKYTLPSTLMRYQCIVP